MWIFIVMILLFLSYALIGWRIYNVSLGSRFIKKTANMDNWRKTLRKMTGNDLIVLKILCIFFRKRLMSFPKENAQDFQYYFTFTFIGYPVVFFIVFFPLGLDRLLLSGNINAPFSYLMFAVCLFVANGFFNAMVYPAIVIMVTYMIWVD